MKKNIFVCLMLLWSAFFSTLAGAAENAVLSPFESIAQQGGKQDSAPPPDVSKTRDINNGIVPPTGRVTNPVVGFSLPNTTLQEDICPPIESLVRDEQTQQWTGAGGWKTTSPSFLRSVDAFVGAQWVGISIGEVICIYIKTTRSSFPVMLKRGKLVPAPQRGGLWSEDKGGYMECKSNDIHMCPFWVQVPQKEKSPYEQLDFYKGKPVESSD